MAVVTAQMVKELREMTLAGMADCKKALDIAEGDMDKAVVVLRERGLASAAKKASRAASEGVVTAVVENNCEGFLFEVNCETDFVTKNEHFQKFVAHLDSLVSKTKPETLEALLETKYDAEHSVQGAATALIARIGENITVRRFTRVGSGHTFITSYVHGGGKIGVLVELTGTNIKASFNNPALVELGKDVALQIAAMKAQYVNDSEIPAEVIKSEEGIIRNKFLAQGKPEAALAKIVPSSLKTWFKEVCLTEQLFVKDDSKSVSAHLSDVSKKLGISDLKIVSFKRLELGEGVEKKTEE